MSHAKKKDLIDQKPKRCLALLSSPRPNKEDRPRNKLRLPRAMSTIVEENLNVQLRDVNQNVLELLDAAERCGRCVSKGSLVASSSMESKRTDSKVSTLPDSDPSATSRDIESLTFCSSRKSRSFHFTTSRPSSIKIEDEQQAGGSHKHRRRHSATSKLISKKSLSNSDIYTQNFTVYPVHTEFFMRRGKTGSNTEVSKQKREHEQRQPSILSGILRKSILSRPNEYKTVGVNVCNEIKNMIKDNSPFRKNPTYKQSDVPKSTKHHRTKPSEKHLKRKETKRKYTSSKHFLEQHKNISPSSSLDDYRLYQRKSPAKKYSEYKLDHGKCHSPRKSHHKEKQPKKRARHTASHDKMDGSGNCNRKDLDKYADLYLGRGDFKKIDTKSKSLERPRQMAHSPITESNQGTLTNLKERDHTFEEIEEKRVGAKCESGLIRIKQSLLQLTGFNKRSKSKSISKHSDKATGRSPSRAPIFDIYTMSVKVPSSNNVQRFFELDKADLFNLCSCEPINSLKLKPTITRAELGTLEIPPYKPKKHESRRRRKHKNEGPSVDTWTMPCTSALKEPAVEEVHVHNTFLSSYDSHETGRLCDNLSLTSLADTTNMMVISEICSPDDKTITVPKNKEPAATALNRLSYNEYKKLRNTGMLDTLSIKPRFDKYPSFLMEPYCYMSYNSIQTRIQNKGTNTDQFQDVEDDDVKNDIHKANKSFKQHKESVKLLTDKQSKESWIKVESVVKLNDTVHTNKKCGSLPKSKIPILINDHSRKKYLASLEVAPWVDVNQKKSSNLPRTNLDKSIKKDTISTINRWDSQEFGFDLDNNFLENMIKSKENINLEEEVFDFSWGESECILNINNDTSARLQTVKDLDVPLESNKIDSSISKLLFKTRNKLRKYKDRNSKIISNRSNHDLKIEKIDSPQKSIQSHHSPELTAASKNATFIVNLADLDDAQRDAINSNSKALLEDSLRRITSKINMEDVKKHVREHDMQSVSLQVLVPSNNVDTNTSNHFIPRYVVRRSSPGKSKLPIPIGKHKQSIKKTYTFPIEIDLSKVGMGEEIGSNVSIEDMYRDGNRRATERPNEITNNLSFHEQSINLEVDKIDKANTKTKFSSIRLKLFSLRWWRGILSKKAKGNGKKVKQQSVSLTLSNFQELIELPGQILQTECQKLVMKCSKSMACLSNSKSMVILPILRSLSDTSININESVSNKIWEHKLLILQYQEKHNPLLLNEQYDAVEKEVVITNYNKIPPSPPPARSSSEILSSPRNPTYKTRRRVNYSCCQRYQKQPKNIKTIFDKPPAHVHSDSEFEATRKMLHLPKPEDYISMNQEAKQEVEKKIHEWEDRIIEREKEHVLKEDKREEDMVLRKLNKEAEQFRDVFEDIYTPITRCDFGMTYYNFKSQLRHFLLETDTLKMLTPCVKGHMHKAPPEVPPADVEPVLVNVASQACEKDFDTMVGSYIFPDIENIIVDENDTNKVDSNPKIREMQDLENKQTFLYEIYPDYSMDNAEVTVKPSTFSTATSCDCTKQHLGLNISLNDDITISLSAYPDELEIHVVFHDTEFKIVFGDDTSIECDYESYKDIIYYKQCFLEKLYKKLSKHGGKLLRRIRDVLVCPVHDLIGSEKYRELAIEFIDDVKHAILYREEICYLDAVKIKKLQIKYRKLPRKVFSPIREDLDIIAEVPELPIAQCVESVEKDIQEEDKELRISDNSRNFPKEITSSNLLSAKNSYSCNYLNKYVNSSLIPPRVSQSCICLLKKKQPSKNKKHQRDETLETEIEISIGDDGLDKVADLCRKPFHYTLKHKPGVSCKNRSKLDQFCNTRDIVPAPIQRYFYACSQVRVRHPPILWVIAKSMVTKRKKYRPKLFRRHSRHRRIHGKSEFRQNFDTDNDDDDDVETSGCHRESNCSIERRRRKMSKCCSTSRCHSHRRRYLNHPRSLQRGSVDDNSGPETDGSSIGKCSKVKISCASCEHSAKRSTKRRKFSTISHKRYIKRQRCDKEKSCSADESCTSIGHSSIQFEIKYIENELNTTTSEEREVSYLESKPDLPAQDVQVSPELNAPPPQRSHSEPVANVNPSLTYVTMCNTSCNAVVQEPSMADRACGHSKSSNDSNEVKITKVRNVSHVKQEKKRCGCPTTNLCGKKSQHKDIKHNPSPNSAIIVDSIGSQEEITKIAGDAVLVLDTEPGKLENKQHYLPGTVQSTYRVTTHTNLNPGKPKISMTMLTDETVMLNQHTATCSYISSQIQTLLSLKPTKTKNYPWYRKMTFKRNPKHSNKPSKKRTTGINYSTSGNILPGIAQTSITILPTFNLTLPKPIEPLLKQNVRYHSSFGTVQELLPAQNLQSSAETSLMSVPHTEGQSPRLLQSLQALDSVDNMSHFTLEKMSFRGLQGQNPTNGNMECILYEGIGQVEPQDELLFTKKDLLQITDSAVVVKFTAHTLDSIDSEDVPITIRKPDSCDISTTIPADSKCHQCNANKEKTINENIRMMTVEELPDTLDEQLLKAVNLNQSYLYTHYAQTDYDLYIQSNLQSISMANYFPRASANEPDMSILSSVPTVSRLKYQDHATEQGPRSRSETNLLKHPQDTSNVENGPVVGFISKSKIAPAIDKVPIRTAFTKLKETLFPADVSRNIRHTEQLKIDKDGHVKYISKVKNVGTNPDTASTIKRMHSRNVHCNKIIEKFSEKKTKSTGIKVSTTTKTTTTLSGTKFHEHISQTDPKHHEKIVQNTTIQTDAKTGSTVAKVKIIQTDPDRKKTVTQASDTTEYIPKHRTAELPENLSDLKHTHAETMTSFDKDDHNKKSNLKPVGEEKSAQVSLVKQNYKFIQFPQNSQLSTSAEESGLEPSRLHSASQEAANVTPHEATISEGTKGKKPDESPNDENTKERKHEEDSCCSKPLNHSNINKRYKSVSPAKGKLTCCGKSHDQYSSGCCYINNQHKKAEHYPAAPKPCCQDKIDKQVSVRPNPQIIIDNLAPIEEHQKDEAENKCCKSANTSNTSKCNSKSRVKKDKSVSYFTDRRHRKFRDGCCRNTACAPLQKINCDTACRKKHRNWVFKDCCEDHVKKNFYTQTRKKFKDTHYECCMPKEDITYTPHCAWPNRKGCDEIDCVPKGCEYTSCTWPALRKKCDQKSCAWPAVKRRCENSSCISVRNYGWKGCCAHVKRTPKYVFKDCCDDDIIKDFYKMGQDKFMKIYPSSCWPRMITRSSDEIIDTYYDMKSSGPSKHKPYNIVDSGTARTSKHKFDHEMPAEGYKKQQEYIFNDCCNGETIEIFHKVGMEKFKHMYPQCCWPKIVEKAVYSAGTSAQTSNQEDKHSNINSARSAKSSELLKKYEYILKECCGEKEKALLAKLGFDKFARLYPQCCVSEKGTNKCGKFPRQYKESTSRICKTCCTNYNRKHCNRRPTCYDYETDDEEILIRGPEPNRILQVTPSKYYFKQCCNDEIKTDFYKKGTEKFKKENPSCCWPVNIDTVCCDYTPSEWKTLVQLVKHTPELKQMLPKFCDKHEKKLTIDVGKHHKSSNSHEDKLPSIPIPAMTTIQSVETPNSGQFHQPHHRTTSTGNNNEKSAGSSNGYHDKYHTGSIPINISNLIGMDEHDMKSACSCKKQHLYAGEMAGIKSDHCHYLQHNAKDVQKFKCLCKRNKLDIIKGHFCMDDSGKCSCKKHPTHSKPKHSNKATTYTVTNFAQNPNADTEAKSKFSLLDQIDNYFGPPRSISEPIMMNMEDRCPPNATNNFNMSKPKTFIKSLMPFMKTKKLIPGASQNNVPYSNKANKCYTFVKVFNPQVMSIHSMIQVNDDEDVGTLFERKRESKTDFSHTSTRISKPVHSQDEKNIKFLEEVELIDYKKERNSKKTSFKAESSVEAPRTSLKQGDVAEDNSKVELSNSKILLSKLSVCQPSSVEPELIHIPSAEASPRISDISPILTISNWSLTSNSSSFGTKTLRTSMDKSPSGISLRSSTERNNGTYASIAERNLRAEQRKQPPYVALPEPMPPAPPKQKSEITIDVDESDDSETPTYPPMQEVHYQKKNKSVMEWMISKLIDFERKAKVPKRKLTVKPTLLTRLFRDRKEDANAATPNGKTFPCGCRHVGRQSCICHGCTTRKYHCKAKKKKHVIEYSFVDNTSLYAGYKSLHKIRQTSYRSIFEMTREGTDEEKQGGQAYCKVYEVFPRKEECVMNSKSKYGMNLNQEIAIGGAGQCTSASKLSTIAEKTEYEADGINTSTSEEIQRDIKEIMHVYKRLNRDSCYECIGLREQLGNRLPHILTKSDYEPELNEKDYIYPTTVKLPISNASIGLERKNSKVGKLIKKVKCSLSRLKLRRVKPTILPAQKTNSESRSPTRQSNTTTKKKIHNGKSLKSLIGKASKTNSECKEEIQIGGTSYIIRAPSRSDKTKNWKSQRAMNCNISSAMSLKTPHSVDVANNVDFNITNSKFDIMKELVMQNNLDKIVKLQEEIDWINQRIAGKYRDSALKVLLDASMQIKEQLQNVIYNSTYLSSAATLTKPRLSEKAVEVVTVNLHNMHQNHPDNSNHDEAIEEIIKEKPAKQDPTELITFRESILRERERIRKEELNRKKEAFVEVLKSGREISEESEISSTSTDTCALLGRHFCSKCKTPEVSSDESQTVIKQPNVSNATHLLVKNISSESGSVLHHLQEKIDVLGTYVPESPPVYPVLISSLVSEENASDSDEIDSEEIAFEAQNFTWNLSSTNISTSSLNHSCQYAVENILVPTNTIYANEPDIMLVPCSKQPQHQKRKKRLKKATETLRLRLKFLSSSNESRRNSPQPYLLEKLSETSYSDDNEYVLNVHDYQKRGSILKETSSRRITTDTNSNLSNVRLLSSAVPSRNESTAHSYHNRYNVESYSVYESRQTQRHCEKPDNKTVTKVRWQNTHMSDKHKY